MILGDNILKFSNNNGYIRFRQKNIKIFKRQVFTILFNILISIIFGFVGSSVFVRIYSKGNSYLKDASRVNLGYDYGVTSVMNKLSQSVVEVSAYIKDKDNDLVQKSMIGVLYSEDGYIVTNFFELDNAEKVYARIPTTLNVVKEARIIGYSQDYDICLLKIDGSGYVKGNFKENISGITHGLKLISIGNVAGNLNSCSIYHGIVSGFGIVGDNIKVIKSDIKINSSNTGGPISDINGDIIGINSVNVNDKFNIFDDGLSILISSQDILKLVDEIIMSAT